MNIGPLDKRCRIERPITTPDAVYGTPVVSWALVGVRWCRIEDEKPSDSETVKNHLGQSTARAKLRLRYCTDVDSTCRITILRPTAKVYQIISEPAEFGDKDAIDMMVARYSS